MKICFVIGSLSYSGAEKVLSALISEMERKKHEIHIILLQNQGEKNKLSENIYSYGAFTEGNKLSRILKRSRLIRKRIKNINPDIVVSFGYVSNINTIPSMLKLDIPLVICERNDPNYDPFHSSQKKIRKIFYSLAQGYVFQTTEVQKYFSEKIRKKSAVIPNPVITSPEEINTNEKYENKRKQIVTVARLEDYQKNQTMLIKGFANASIDLPEHDLFIYGDGPDKEKYHLLINELNMENRIFLMGATKNVQNILNKTDIFVLTSNFEGMPNALIEAMAMGLPCISTDCGGGGAKALISNRINGLLIEKDNCKQLQEALLLLNQDYKMKEKLGKEASKIRFTLNINDVSDEWLTYFKTVIEREK